MVCGLYEYQRLISNSCFPLWQGRVWDLEHWVSLSDPCVWFGEGPQIQARNGLFLLCGYNKPPISGQHSPMFHSCCSITHRLNAPPSPKPGDKIGCSQPCFQRDFCPCQNHSNLPRHSQMAPVCKNAGAELHLQSCCELLAAHQSSTLQ